MSGIKIEYLSRLMAVGVGVLIAVTSIMNIAMLGMLSVSNLVMSVYYLLFGVVLICAEFDLQVVVKRFHLLESQLGKLIYCVIIGLVMLDADGIRFVCAIVLISFGLYHIVPYFIKRRRGALNLEDKYAANSEGYVNNIA